jgi:SAM-dependent methyltransferase
MSEFQDFAPFAQRARSFGSIAQDYARFRPPPPPEAVEWVLERGGRDVVDLGAGTGALTDLLARRADHVVAVEPDAQMREVLHERLKDVPIVAAVAENLPFRDQCFDVATAASSWHWMDPVKTPIEVGRVLRPGGTLGLLWNGADRGVEWVEETLGPQQADQTAWPAPVHRHAPEIPDTAPFRDLEFRLFRWALDLTLAELVGLMGSYSRVFTLPDGPRENLLARAEVAGRKRLELTGKSTIELPMNCACWRTTRT